MRRPTLILFSFCLSALPGCGKSKAGPTFTDVATTIKAKVGSEFSITLGSNITTGYTWEFKTAPDLKLISLVDEKYEAPAKSDQVGAAGKQRFRFKVLAPGATKLDLQYVRPWEDPRQSVQTAVFSVELA